jgi:hypothetical protein
MGILHITYVSVSIYRYYYYYYYLLGEPAGSRSKFFCAFLRWFPRKQPALESLKAYIWLTKSAGMLLLISNEGLYLATNESLTVEIGEACEVFL